jgi:hypothetical protein
MSRFHSWIAVVLALALPALCLAGCFSTPESRQAKEGKALMEAYLKTRDAKKVSVDSAKTERDRPAPDRIEMTEFVYGKYRIDGQEYEYLVNVRTGEIFTTERMDDLEAACYDLMCAELGVDPARCVGLCNVDFIDAPSNRLLPAAIEDAAAYESSHLHSDVFAAYLWLVCPASEVPPGGWTAEDTANWNHDEAHVCVMPAGEALPELGNGVYLGYTYFQNFTGDKYQLSEGAADFTPHT